MKTFVSALLIMALFASCGGEKKAALANAKDFLTDKIAGVDRVSDVRVFAGDSLSQYIDGDAEMYLSSNCREVATADYKGGESEMTVDIYRFDTPANTAALYHRLNAGGGTALPVGTEGFVSLGQVNFIKGIFLVRITGFDDSDMTSLLLAGLAANIAASLPLEE